MTGDEILYWVAFALVVTGLALTFTRWWDKGYLFMASGMGNLGFSSLWRGRWPEDAYWAAGSFAWGLALIYIAYRKERNHARTEEHEGQEHGGVPEGSGD